MLRSFACSPVVPRVVRTAYVYLAKRALRHLSGQSAIASVPMAGQMELEPWDFVASRLFFFGVWEPSIGNFMAARARVGTVAIDVGANIGYYSLLLRRSVGPTGWVYAVEPSPEIRTRLEANLALNDASNVTVLPFGVSDRGERRAFHHRAGNLGASGFGEIAIDGIELRRLGDLIPENMLSRVSLLKIDVEGMEIAVLRDVFTLLNRLSRDLCIIAELRIDDEMRAVIEQFRAEGFRTLLIENDYRIWRYTAPAAHPPREVEDLADGQHDVVLFRGV